MPLPPACCRYHRRIIPTTPRRRRKRKGGQKDGEHAGTGPKDSECGSFPVCRARRISPGNLPKRRFQVFLPVVLHFSPAKKRQKELNYRPTNILYSLSTLRIIFAVFDMYSFRCSRITIKRPLFLHHFLLRFSMMRIIIASRSCSPSPFLSRRHRHFQRGELLILLVRQVVLEPRSERNRRLLRK